ncbi:hypothetical protein C488_09886 [Natrinema pellirubrum DSM 15624]|uniref:Uncharacterized protein n=1 Tax=Natrinema pellirubrum (strain DSM 15624 / CIP 106293 / JCM 10476 / NCIMB 786 / 157) TaxID=797303 RepID=L9YLI7_NATP1|nr:hypothetical protein C488_09886 [Natrinema pellirubrum DSM 15624]
MASAVEGEGSNRRPIAVVDHPGTTLTTTGNSSVRPIAGDSSTAIGDDRTSRGHPARSSPIGIRFSSDGREPSSPASNPWVTTRKPAAPNGPIPTRATRWYRGNSIADERRIRLQRCSRPSRPGVPVVTDAVPSAVKSCELATMARY